MGNHLIQNQEQLQESIHQEYEIQTHPYLINRKTNEVCMLHKVTTNSQQQSEKIKAIVDEYRRNRGQSISKLKDFYQMDRTGYCSDEQNFYLIFEGTLTENLKQQYMRRRYFNKKFNDQQITHILETYLSGYRQYHTHFSRLTPKINLESIIVSPKTNKMHLKDPYLIVETSQSQTHQSISNILLSYPSPQKLNSAYHSKFQNFDEFTSNLWSIGILGLQLKKTDFADSIYMKRREINYEDIQQRIGQIQNEKLRYGLQVLTSREPQKRKMIYQVWGIDSREQHFLMSYKQNALPKNTMRQSQQNQRNQPNTFQDQENYQRLNHEKHNNYNYQNNQSAHGGFGIIENKRTNYFMNSTPSNQNLQRNQNQNQILAPQQSVQKIPPPPPPPLNINRNPVPSFIKNSSPSPQLNFNQNHIQFTPPSTNNQPKSFSLNHKSIPPPKIDPLKIEHKQNLQYRPQTARDPPPINQYQPPNNFPSTNTANNNKPFEFNKISFQNYLHQKQPQRTFSPPVVKPASTFPSYLPIQFKQSFTFTENSMPQQPLRDSPVKKTMATYQSPKRDSFNIINDQRVNENQVKDLQNLYGINTNDSFYEHDKKQVNIISELTSLIKQEPQHKSYQPINFHQTNQPQQNFLSINDKKQTTPRRPPSKNKYNSTIVEVNSQDTPEKSQEELIEQQYVIQEYETGSRYEGFKTNGLRNGRGKFYYQDGGYYEGQWKNNKMDGWGRLYYEGGKLAYEGEWSQDEFNGVGKVYNDNPVYLNQTFDYTNFDTLEDFWEYYEGMLVKDTKEGRGKIKITNNQMFEGDFHADRIQGFGKFYTLDGKIIEGIWRDSRMIKVINN